MTTTMKSVDARSAVIIPRHQKLQLHLMDAIIDLCRREAFYIEELRIEGTVCVVSDRSSVLVTQITEQIGNHGNLEASTSDRLPNLNKDHTLDSSTQHEPRSSAKSGKVNQNEHYQPKINSTSANKRGGRYKCPFCSKSYTFKHRLKDHLNLHTGRKPHVCKMCLMSFSQLGVMCTHMKSEHGRRLSGRQVCCSCHSQGGSTASTHEPSIGEPDAHLTMKSKQLNNNNNKLFSDTSSSIRPRVNNEHDQISCIQGRVENIKQEFSDTTASETIAGITDKDSDSVLDIQNFLHQYENGRDKGSGNHDVLQEVSNRANKELTPVGRGMGLGEELARVIGVATSEQNLMPRAESVALTQSPVAHPAMSQCMPSAAMEMLAHMALGPPVTQSFPTLPDLTHVLSVQKQQHWEVSAPMSTFTMPPANSLQRSKDGKFQCPFCVKTYNFKHTLKDHINKHLGNRPHICKHCGDTFTHLASLCAHIKRRHDNQMTCDYQCELCREKFMNLQSLKQHFTWRHKDVKFCPQQFLQSAHGVVPESDIKPLPSVPLPVGMDTIQPLVNSVDALSATTAPRTGSTEGGLTTTSQHSVHTTTASSSLTTSTGLALPQSHAHNTSPIPTISLPASHLTNDFFEDRLKGAAQPTPAPPLPSNSQPQFPGDFVYPGFHDNKQLECVGSLPVLAPSSPVGDENMSLTTHIADYFQEVNLQTDQGLYRYKCRLCGNLFKIRNSLYEHLNSHLGRKPYVCGTCGDSFTHHSSLHNHSRNKHSLQTRQERQACYRHACPGCHKKFQFPSELDRHYKTNPDHNIQLPVNSRI